MMHLEHEESAVHRHEHTHSDGTVHSHEHTHPHEHEHGHSHAHTHADGTVHSHEHTHPHEHTHEAAGCGVHCGEGVNCADCGHEHVSPRQELIALMKYMVGHNASHANELAQLAKQLQDLGETTAYEQIMLAVSDFEKGNLRLSTVLAAMNA